MNKGIISLVGIVIVAFIGAAVALAYAHWDSIAIAGLLTALAPIVVSFLVLVVKTDHQTEKIQQISEQTDSVLDRRIVTGATKALDNRLPHLADKVGDAVVEKIDTTHTE